MDIDRKPGQATGNVSVWKNKGGNSAYNTTANKKKYAKLHKINKKNKVDHSPIGKIKKNKKTGYWFVIFKSGKKFGENNKFSELEAKKHLEDAIKFSEMRKKGISIEKIKKKEQKSNKNVSKKVTRINQVHVNPGINVEELVKQVKNN
jgi:hypothetical protein